MVTLRHPLPLFFSMENNGIAIKRSKCQRLVIYLPQLRWSAAEKPSNYNVELCMLNTTMSVSCFSLTIENNGAELGSIPKNRTKQSQSNAHAEAQITRTFKHART
ncbi:conserved hypothetical protein [Trichinella spiralis]|uniref:hypothetical protein n=1 Tax=Trichinella spiralis TaxID=6334 RepID=UPI0001EFB537|nr:conserved hypothetical protein [Trichinella spiralis]